jgi:hypothetical protein
VQTPQGRSDGGLWRRNNDRSRRLNLSTAALDDPDLALGLCDFQFGYVGLGYQINQGLEFAQIHGLSNNFNERNANLHQNLLISFISSILESSQPTCKARNA